MKNPLPTQVSQDVVYVNDVRELKGVKGLSNKRLCVIRTDFKDINRIKKICKSYPGLEIWLACRHVSRDNIVTANMCGIKNIVEYPLREELIEELFGDKPPKSLIKKPSRKDREKYKAIKGLTVMIVDDNPLNTELLEETLKDLGLKLFVFQKPKEAAKIVNIEKIDLFLLDIMMPDMSGFDLAGIIQKTKLNANSPIIFISALSDREHKVKSFDLGSCAYIEKPFDVNVVKSQICSLLKSHKDNEKLSQSKDSYIAMVIHDMKGPVQAELCALKLMTGLYGANLNEEQKEILGDVISSTKYLQNLVANILEKYKGDNGKIVITKSLNSFKKLVSECCDEVKYLALEKNLLINVSYKSAIDYIYFDYDEIKRVINNILTNGIKYSFKNREIKVTVTNDRENIIFSVANKGFGLDIKKVGNVFDKFTSYCEEQKSVNAGLGLYISKKIIDEHGGTIKFDSIPNESTIVTFTLPVNVSG